MGCAWQIMEQCILLRQLLLKIVMVALIDKHPNRSPSFSLILRLHLHELRTRHIRHKVKGIFPSFSSEFDVSAAVLG